MVKLSLCSDGTPVTNRRQQEGKLADGLQTPRGTSAAAKERPVHTLGCTTKTLFSRYFRLASATQAHVVEPSNVDDGVRKQMRDNTTTRKASEKVKAHALDWPRLFMLNAMPRTASPSVAARPGGALVPRQPPPREAAGSRPPFNSRGAEAKNGSWGHIL